METKSDNFNIASYLPVMAEKYPEKKAVIAPSSRRVSYEHYTFSQLEEVSNRYAAGFKALGMKKSDRVVLFVKPGLDFIAITFALFKIGAVPVLIDPGMGKKNLLACIALVKPTGFIAIPIAHAMRVLYGKYFKSVRHFVTVGRRWFWGGDTLDGIAKASGANFGMCVTKRSDMAAILFTTGSTGAPKGVVYEHGMFDAQLKSIKRAYNITKDDVDLPAFPLFALFDAAWGITSVIPDMNPAKPVLADPAKIIRAINDHSVSITFGSPAIWDNVGKYCVERGVRLPSLKRILMAGAPVPAAVLQRFRDILPHDGDTHTPYGATESLPVASIPGSEILRETAKMTAAGKGCCVGAPVPGMTVRIIRLTDDVISEWDDSLLLPAGEVGEIAVKGDVVTKQYFGREKATNLAKIPCDDELWHRMGDVGYFDEKGRLWFCGRKAHRVITKDRTLFSVMCEGVFNSHEDVFRSALVRVGKAGQKVPVIIIQPQEGKMPQTDADKDRFKNELLKIGGKNSLTADIKEILFHPAFPVDIRHNAKIFREKLAIWAQT